MSRLRVLQELLAEDVAEEDADQVDPPEVLQLLGEEGHRLVQATRRESNMSETPQGPT